MVKTTDNKTKKTVYKATIVFEKKSKKIEEEEKKAGRSEFNLIFSTRKDQSTILALLLILNNFWLMTMA